MTAVSNHPSFESSIRQRQDVPALPCNGCRVTSGVFREGGGCATAPPPVGVIRGAMVGVWLDVLSGSTEESGKK
jgi:hypothetical protein